MAVILLCARPVDHVQKQIRARKAHLSKFRYAGVVDLVDGSLRGQADVVLYVSAVHKGEVDGSRDVRGRQDQNIWVPAKEDIVPNKTQNRNKLHTFLRLLPTLSQLLLTK